MPEVFITMPAYRAQATIAKTVADIPIGVADRLILVDDASPDGTAQIARDLGVSVFEHPVNRGYGGNQKTCYTEAIRGGAEVIVLLHPDYQYDPKAVPLLIAPILAGDADMTFGSRFAGLGDPLAGGMPPYRFADNRLATMVENLMLGSRFTDMHSGLRAYTRECLMSLPFLRYSDDFWFDSELLIDAVTSGQRVVEVPIPTRYTKESSSIDVGRSLTYVAKSLAYCARRTAARGRRGARSPVVAQHARRGPRLASTGAVERMCVLCGNHRQDLVYQANAFGDVAVEEFACTTGALSSHDDIVQCRSCSLISSIPTLGTGEIVEHYERVEDTRYLQEEAGRRELFGWVADQLGGFATPGKHLLEIGANVGLFLDVARSRGWSVQGIEPSKWAVAEGRDRFGVDLRQGTIEALDVTDASMDAVVMLDVLEHLSDPLEGLRAARRAIADDGILALSTVDVSGAHARVRGGDWPWFIRSHLWYFSPWTVRELLRRSGFELVEWSVVPRAFRLSYIASRLDEHSALGRSIARASRVADPKVPVGWLGDITLALARPVASGDAV